MLQAISALCGWPLQHNPTIVQLQRPVPGQNAAKFWEQRHIITLPVTVTPREINLISHWPLKQTMSPLLICISSSNCASRSFQGRPLPAGLLADYVAFISVARLKDALQ